MGVGLKWGARETPGHSGCETQACPFPGFSVLSGGLQWGESSLAGTTGLNLSKGQVPSSAPLLDCHLPRGLISQAPPASLPAPRMSFSSFLAMTSTWEASLLLGLELREGQGGGRIERREASLPKGLEAGQE